MTAPHDDHGLMSRLPDDDAYWEDLTDRLVHDATERLEAYRRGSHAWWHGLSRAAAPLTLAAVAAVVLAVLWLPEVPGPDGELVPDVFGITPTDAMADRLLGSSSPPTLATLIVTPSPEATR
jgi:hypothetical protein